MSGVVLVGRVLFAILFLSSAYAHLAQAKAMIGYAESKGVPLARLAVPGSGVVLLLGALMVLFGVWADLGALLLVVFLLPTAILMHGFWKEGDAQAKQTEMIQFNKDTALAGASLMLFAFFAGAPDLGLTITGPMFHLG